MHYAFNSGGDDGGGPGWLPLGDMLCLLIDTLNCGFLFSLLLAWHGSSISKVGV